MEKATFFNVHKDFAQDGPIYGHEEFFGLTENAARAKYHELLAAVYSANDPWTHVYVNRDDGIGVFGEVVDRRSVQEMEE